MNKVIKLFYAGLFLLMFANYSPALAFKTVYTNSVSYSEAPSLHNPTKEDVRSTKRAAKQRKKLARKQQRLNKFLKSRLGKWLIKRAIKKQQRREKRWQRKYERKKKRWLAKGKDITKLKKKQRRGNPRTGILLLIIGALFFFVLGTLSPFDIIGIIVAAIGLFLILLYLLT
ncbi:hypothetical protein BKI52_05770 [marine bacterium AO1-C]|nr:hypothetical protein BKI52_05770 [marine bacterium AO1-C]